MSMQLETINRLYLELAQVTTATTPREQKLKDALLKLVPLLEASHGVAIRRGKNTDWRWLEPSLKNALDEVRIML